MSSFYEITSCSMLRKEINRRLKELGLPEERYNDDTEKLFFRLYDIKTFGESNDDNVRKMFLDKETQINICRSFIDEAFKDLCLYG